jgi:hypothetical protein
MHQSKSEKEKYLSHTTREIFYAKISNSTQTMLMCQILSGKI